MRRMNDTLPSQNLSQPKTASAGPRDLRGDVMRFVRAAARVLLAGVALATAALAAAEDNPKLRLSTTLGDIDIELYPAKAPMTTKTILARVDEGFYDGLVFHRVVANFVIQTGGYDKDLNYREPPATVPNESYNGLQNLRGTVAMARQSDPDSADAQFFINMNHNMHLNTARGRPGYTVFGRVVAGMAIAEAIELSDTSEQGGMVGVPDTPIIITSAARL